MATINAATAVVNANLPSTQATFYDSVAIDTLFDTLVFQNLATERTLPLNSGKTIKMFVWDKSPFTSGVTAGNTPTAATEGTVGTGITPTQTSVSATLGQYADFVTVSDFMLQVDISQQGPLEGISRMLGFRGAMVVDTLLQLEFDAAVTSDSTIGVDLADGTYMTANTLRSAVSFLLSRNAKPFPGGNFRGVMSPLVAGDTFNDATNNGLTDILKRNPEGVKLLQNGVNDQKAPITFAGVDWYRSTNVPLTSNVPTTGKSAYSSYISSYEAILAIGLGKTEIPDANNFQTKIQKFTSNQADPAGMIGGAASFNFKYVAALRPGTQVCRRIRSESAIA